MDSVAHERFRLWIRDAALPFWSTVGCDPDGLGFEERLNLAGGRDRADFKRVRVQARQIYVYSHAYLLGWTAGLAVAARGYEFLTAEAWRAEGGWARRLGPRGGILDPDADLYDIAFVLFAFAWYGRATGAREPIDWAHRTIDWLDAHMASPRGGYLDSLPPADERRRQNPHMHLLEAALALYETSGEPRFADLAHRMVALFRNAFYDPVSRTLGEVFDNGWVPAAGAAGNHVEPGHHYEWVWLLGRYEALTGVSVAAEAIGLYEFANAHGIDHATGLVVDLLDRRGAVLDPSVRIWPQTEVIKARIAMSEPFSNHVQALFSCFLDSAPAGAWNDHFDVHGRGKSLTIPASSFYHIFMAFGEMCRTVESTPSTTLSLGSRTGAP